ncbi:MAG: ADP-ribosylation factor-like protein [candidate division WOR-3 bacterium]|nr:ADP-ribosylation factor-like protein [candidate division WOR-3 bacterium]
MSLINYSSKEINCKLVYYGPGLGGKTTNIKYVYSKVNPESRGKLMSLDTELDRTLFFDFLPVNLGKVRGFTLHFHLYTVPGQVYYNASRKLILKGTDGLIFVADSQIERFEDNIESLENLKENLAEYGAKLADIPLTMQYNKRDLPNIVSIEELEEALNPRRVFFSEGVAIRGIGVFEPLKEVSKKALRRLK